MSVNLFGVARVTKAFLPLIRKSQGRVVNMSSVLGCSADHYAGPYSISKFGVEAFSDILRLEMRQFNVRVCIIEPGNFISATSIIAGPNSLQTLGRQSWEKLDPSLKKDYGEERFEKMIGLVQVLRDFSVSSIDSLHRCISSLKQLLWPRQKTTVSLLKLWRMRFIENFQRIATCQPSIQ